MLVPDVGEVATALSAPRLLLLVGRSGCVQCSDLALAASTWSNEHRPCVLVHLDDDAGLEAIATHPFLSHLDVLPVVVPLLDGAPLEVVHGHTPETLNRAWSLMEG
jgi:hypothetical protein